MKSHSSRSTRNPSSVRRCPPVKESFSGPVMTAYGGAGLLRRFVDKLQLREQFERVAPPQEGFQYQPADYLTALVSAALVGCERQCEIADLRRDPGALMALGLPAMPSQTSLSRFFAACTSQLTHRVWATNRRLIRRLRADLRSATLDLDGQVVSTRGNPERADFGFNKKRRGAKSYFMQMAFIGETRDILYAHDFPGSEASFSGRRAVWLYRKARRAVGHITKLRLRADSAYYSHELLSQLEADDVLYFIAARASVPLKNLARQAVYRRLSDKWAISEFSYRGAGWTTPRRFVVIREKLEPENPVQPTLFHDDRYAYQIIATNADWSPERVWHFYNHRSCLENIIKESQSDFGSNHILCQSFWGNAVWLALSALAYNVTNWFREKALNQRAHRHTAQWLRERLILIPARVVRTGRQLWLRMWRDHPWRERYERAVVAIAAFHLRT